MKDIKENSEDIELKVSKLTKKYGDFIALNAISFEMKKGIYAILGLNGAGKTTMINLITDNIKRTDGNIFFNGIDILKLGQTYRDLIGYMPQEQGYYGEFTPRSYLYYIAKLKGIKKKEISKKIDQLLDLLNLADVADKKMSKFSGGMRQRTVLAQALLNDPTILILDEPTAGLDPKERINLKKYIKDISQNKIVIYCTHVVSDIENIADQVILMKSGNIVKMCNVEDIYNDISSNFKTEIHDLEQAFVYYMQ